MVWKWVKRLFAAEGENKNTEAYQLWKRLQEREKELLIEAKEKDASLRNEALELKEKELYLKRLKLKIKEAELKEELGEYYEDDDRAYYQDREDDEEEPEEKEDFAENLLKNIMGGMVQNVSSGNTGSKREDRANREVASGNTEDSAQKLERELTDEQRKRAGL